MAETVKMEGFEAVRLALLETPKHLRKKVMHAILIKAAQPILRAARANAPVASKSTSRVIPGLLKRTLGVTRSKIRNAASGDFGVFITARTPGKVKRLGRAASRAGIKGPNFGDPFYHRFQEGGFHAVGSRKNAKTGRFIGGLRVKGGKRRRAENLSSMVKAGTARYIQGKNYLGNAFEAHKHAAVNIIQSDLVKATVAAFEKRAKK